MAMHIEDIKALAQNAHNDTRERERLFRAMLDRARLADYASATPDTSMRRLAMVLLDRLEWSVDDVRTDLLDFCLDHMMLPDEPYGVKALCIKLAYLQCRHYPELKAELRQALLLMEPEELGAGVKHTRKKTLERL